jgi:hypothetical protein
VDPRAGLDDLEKRKFLKLPGLELNPSVVQLVARRYTDCNIPALCLSLIELNLFLLPFSEPTIRVNTFPEFISELSPSKSVI